MPDMDFLGSVATEYEYAPLRIPPDTNASAATTLLTMQAESGGWELDRVRLHADGTRRVWLRRTLRHRGLPGPVL